MHRPWLRALLARIAFVIYAFLWSPGATQEPSVVLKSLDNLEKRVTKVEEEMGRIRKLAPRPEKPARSDSALGALGARLDSLAVRVDALSRPAAPVGSAAVTAEKATGAAASATTPAAATSTSAVATPAPTGEIADLVREVKELTALLRGRAAQAASATPPKTQSAAPATQPPPTPGPTVTSLLPGFELKGDIQIQGERKITSQSGRDNLDDFWGRLNFGGEYKSGGFESKLNIRIFPEGFGFEPLTGATFDTAGQGSLKVQTAPQARVVINHAWVKYALGAYRLKVGRFETVETQSDNFGNYIDLAPSGKFMSRPAVHNAVEMSRSCGPLASSLLFGTNDRKLNRGFVRVYEKYAPAPALLATLGWRANVFDRFRYENDDVLNRFDAGLAWAGLPRGWKVFTEAALLQYAGLPDETPVLLGLQPACGKALDLLSLETEWSPTRKMAGRYKEWLFNVHARKALGRVKFDAGWYSDLLDPDPAAFGAGFRVTSNIK